MNDWKKVHYTPDNLLVIPFEAENEVFTALVRNLEAYIAA